jgi:hypothetical protein
MAFMTELRFCAVSADEVYRFEYVPLIAPLREIGLVVEKAKVWV